MRLGRPGQVYRAMTPVHDHPTRRALVVGAGPAGLAVAYCLRAWGVRFDLVDRRGAPGGAYRLIRPDLTLLSVARNASLPGLRFDPGTRYATAGAYRDYLVRYARAHGLEPRTAEVASLERSGPGYSVWFADGGEPVPFGAVVVATGMFDHPHAADIPGLPAPAGQGDGSPTVLHSATWPGATPYRGGQVLVLGGGTSGVELAEDCAAAGVAVTLSARRAVRLLPKRLAGLDVHQAGYHLMRFAPRSVVERYCAGRLPTLPVDRGFRGHVRAGRVRLAGPVLRFEGRTAVFQDGGREGFDAVALATGYRFKVPFLPAGSAPSPGIFFVGHRCARTVSSEFLKGIAADAPVVARRVVDHLTSAGVSVPPPGSR